MDELIIPTRFPLRTSTVLPHSMQGIIETQYSYKVGHGSTFDEQHVQLPDGQPLPAHRRARFGSVAGIVIDGFLRSHGAAIQRCQSNVINLIAGERNHGDE